MLKSIAVVGLSLVALAPGLIGVGLAQTAPAQKSPAKAQSIAAPKAGPGEKVCRHKFPDGTPKAWVCKQEEPCCAWDEIRYVKCGSTTFKCL